MSFPNVIHGPEGEQFHRYTTQRWPLGTKLQLVDQRMFRFGGTGAAAGGIAGGRLVTHRTNTTLWESMTINGNGAPAIGATTVTVTPTLSNSSFTLDQFAQGYLLVQTSSASTPGLYRIQTHPANATTGTATQITLSGGSGLVDSYSTGATVALFASPWSKLVISSTGTSPVGRPMGVTNTSLSSAAFGWFQTAGPGPILADGTLVVGTAATPSTAIAGAVASPTSTAFSTASFNPNVTMPVGNILSPSADTKFAMVYITLDS